MSYEKTMEEVLAEFQADADRRLAEIREKVKSGSGSYADALSLASKSGRAAGKAIGNALIENAVDGAADPELTAQLVPTVLRENYRTVTSATEQVQTSLNEKAGIHLKAQVPDFNQDRSDGLVKEILGKTNIQAFAPVLTQQVENASMSIVDDSVRQNADFHYRAGLSPKIVRTSEWKCCEWCSRLAGTYSYPCKRDVYRRHENCRCVVEYDPGTGKVQNAHTKKIYARDSSAAVKRIKWSESYQNDPFKDRDVKIQYRQDSTPGRGNIDFEKGFNKSTHADEIQTAELIHRTFGGDIVLRSEAKETGVKSADYLWNGSLWELKSPSSEKAADAALRYALKQIRDNPGGIILNYQGNQIDIRKLYAIINNRMARGKSADVMIVQNRKVIGILRY